MLYEKGEGFARITLNRPTVLNAMNKNVQRLLYAALERAEDDDEVKAVILTGAGRAFTAGGDLYSHPLPGRRPRARRDGEPDDNDMVAAQAGHSGGP